MTAPIAPVTGASPSDFADWAEAVALLSGTWFKRGDLKSAVDGMGGDSERLVESAWSELQGRAYLLGKSWPFTLEDSRFIWRSGMGGDQKAIYTYCALLGYSSLSQTDRVLFEQLVHCIVAFRFRGAALRIGHPADSNMPKSFRQRVIYYSRISLLHPEEVGKPPLSDDKDLGLDVVAWYAHDDRRGGDLHFLIQCATGLDWADKTDDIKQITLTPHLNWGATPVRVMCIPRSIVVDEPRWMRWSREAGIIFDRSRLVREFETGTLPIDVRTLLQERIEILSAI